MKFWKDNPMPTYRKLHTRITDSFDFAEMPDDFTRVFWLLLIVIVDSEGRAIDSPAWLRSRMFPLRSDVRDEQIESAMSWLAQREMIIRYKVDGRGYFYVVKFKTYQSGTEREAKSTLPAPPDLLMSKSGVSQEEGKTSSTASVPVSVNESATESERPDSLPERNKEQGQQTARSNVYDVYEKEIGIVTATIASELELAEKDYPAGWVVDAIKEAARNNKRSLKYAFGILRRWKAEGRTQMGRQAQVQRGHKQSLIAGV
jgi:DnaD/phage-associated family protein